MSVNITDSNHFEELWVQVPKREISPIIPDSAPKKSILETELLDIELVKETSGHDVKKMILTSGSLRDQVVFYKKCDSTYPPELAAIEAAASASYRMVRGFQSSVVRPVISIAGKVCGTVSFEIQNFTPIHKINTLTTEHLVKMDIAGELVARYVREEDDLHPGNFGLDYRNRIVGIDFDMSYYSKFSSIYKGARLISGFILPKPSEAFPITEGDIKGFPCIQDAKPCHWPTKMPSNINVSKWYTNQKIFEDLAKDPQFQQQKYQKFLLEILVDMHAHREILTYYFPSKADSDQLHFAHQARITDLRDTLINTDEFRKFLIKNKESYERCLEHFRVFNENYALEGVTVSFDEINRNYLQLVKECMIKDMTMALYDMGCHIKKEAKTPTFFKRHFNNLIDCCVLFQKSEMDIIQAMSQLQCDFSNLFFTLKDEREKWTDYCKNVERVINNYSGLISSENNQMAESLILSHSTTLSNDDPEARINLEKSMAEGIHDWIVRSQNIEKIVTIVKETIQEYAPSQHVYNPHYHTRRRAPELELLITNLEKLKRRKISKVKDIANLVGRFLQSGEWSLGGYLTWPSANVILVSKLCNATFEDFKKRLVLEQLKQQGMADVCFAIETGHWDLKKAAENIGKYFREGKSLEIVEDIDFTVML